MGCVGLFFIFLQNPYSHRKHNNLGDIYRDIVDGVPPATKPTRISTSESQIWLILESCWGIEPSARASAVWILEALHINLAPPSTIHLSSGEPPLLPQVLPSNGMEDGLRTDTNPRASVERQQLTTPTTTHISLVLPKTSELLCSKLPMTKQRQSNDPTRRQHYISPNWRKGQASFSCTVPGCDKAFESHFYLKAHLHYHDEARIFKCGWPGCEKWFVHGDDCTRHEALHLKLWPHTCDGCGKTFVRMEAFVQHIESEEGANCARALDNPPSGSIFWDVK